MINDLDIVQWEYLLSPEFELINSAGKPLTGGWIEVYLHGMRDKYYCASDFNGTLHPFKIPLDSIGANVVLADPNNAYDVYVYNKFGSLIMSRYNVKCQGGGSGSSTYVGDKLYYGQYRARNVTTIANLSRNKGNINLSSDGYLELKSGMSYHITVRGSFTVDNPANEDATLNYIEYTSVNPIKIDIDETKEGPQYFELSYDIYRLQEDMDYQVAFAQANGMVNDLIVEVHSLSNLATSAAGGDQEYEAGWGIDITNNVVSVDPSIFEDYEYTAGDYISIDDNNVISVTGINPGDFATHDEVYEATATAVQVATGLIPEMPEEEEVDFQEINLNDYALASAIPDISDLASHTEVYEATVTAVQVATGAIPEMPEEEEVDFEEIDLNDYVTHIELEEAISAVTGIGDYGQFYATNIAGAATMMRTKGTIDVTDDGKIKLKKGSSYHVTMRGRYNQTTASNTLSTLSLIEYVTNNSISVNVDTTIMDSQYFEISYDLYRLNSDTNYYVFFNVPAGKINDLFVEIHAIGSVGAGVSGGTGTEYDAGWGIQILNNVVSVDPSILNDYTTNDDVYNSTVSAINLVTGMIPEAQVQSDWTEDDSTDPAYIKNKPEEYNLVAGDNITIDVSGTNIVISSEGGIASGASGCNVEFVNILDYRGQITDREPGAQNTYTGGTALANAMRDIMLRGHMPLLVYGTQFVNSEVFTPIWLDTRDFAPGTNGGYSCVPLTGHEFFFKNPVTSFVTTKIVIDALNDKISDFIVSADTVATVGRGLTVDYFGAGDPWVWYEGYGPTPPVSAATTPGLCRIEIASSIPDVTKVQTMIDTSISGIPTAEYTAGSGIDITNNTISVNNTVAMKTDIPELPDDEEVVFEELDLSDYALSSAIPTIQLNSSDQVTAIDGHILAGGQTVSNVAVYTDSNLPNSTQLDADIAAGKAICIIYSGRNYWYDRHSSDYYFYGADAYSGFLYYLYYRPSNDRWSIGQLVVASQTWVNNKGYLPASTIELNGSNQVTAISGHPLAGGGGGSSYTAGEHISIDNNEIAVTGITELVAGNAITITTSGASAIISSTGEAQVQANWNETDTSSKAYIQNKPTIPAAQVQSNWNETNTSSKAYIQNKPTIHNYTGASGIDITNDTISLDNPVGLVAGDNITIEVSGVSAIISSTGGSGSSYTAGTGIDITSDVISVDNTVALKTDIPVVTGFATKTELATVEAEIPTLPDDEEVEFVELDLSDYALASAIPDVSTFATKSELQAVSAAIPDTTDMATQTWVGNQGYLTSVPSNYVTDSELNGAVSGLATTTEVTTGLGTKQNTLTGITDVQVVQSLPVSPVSSVLYLIPEV